MVVHNPELEEFHMSADQEVTITLRIQHDELDPEEVTRLMGFEPDRSNRKGDPRSNPDYAPFRTGNWAYKPTHDESLPFAEQLGMVCDMVVQSRAQLDQLKRRGFYIDVFVGIFGDDSNVCFTVSPSELLILGSVGIPFVLDVYTDCAEP